MTTTSRILPKIAAGLLSADGSTPNRTDNPNTQDGRARRLIKFHLDISRDDDYALQEQFKIWKSNREFLPMLRRALKLLISLMAGSIDLLLELFPGVVQAIRIDAIADAESELQRLQAKNQALRATVEQQEARIAALEADSIEVRQFIQIGNELQAIKAMLSSQQPQFESVPVETPQQPQTAPNSAQTAHNGLTPMSAGKAPNSGLGGAGQHRVMSIAPPVFDDDDGDLLDVKTATRKPGEQSASQRFINAMFALQES